MTAYDNGPAGKSVGSSRKPAPTKSNTERVEIQVADNGGYMVTCYYKQAKGGPGPSAYREPSKHAFGDSSSMMKFVVKSLGS